MKNLTTIWAHVTHVQECIQKAWHTFLFMPARYWKIMLIVFGVILLIILFVDAWLFWRFAQNHQQDLDQTTSERFTLNLKQLESALRFLDERETKLLQKDQTPPPREIFGVPPPSASTE